MYIIFNCQGHNNLDRLAALPLMTCGIGTHTGVTAYGKLELWGKHCTKDWSYDCFLIRKPFPFHSIADPVRSSNVFTDIYTRGRVKEETVVRTSRMGLGTIRTLTDEIQKSCGY